MEIIVVMNLTAQFVSWPDKMAGRKQFSFLTLSYSSVVIVVAKIVREVRGK